MKLEEIEKIQSLEIDGHTILIDADILPKLSEYRWRVVKNVKKNRPDGNLYVRGSKKINGNWKSNFMHRVIMDAIPGNLIDHRNGNGLDNRKANLRVCGNFENQRNRKKKNSPLSSSVFKGVSKRIYKDGTIIFSSSICENAKTEYLGQHQDESMAALLYDKAAYLRDHNFNLTNFPLPIIKYILRLEAVAKAAKLASEDDDLKYEDSSGYIDKLSWALEALEKE